MWYYFFSHLGINKGEKNRIFIVICIKLSTIRVGNRVFITKPGRVTPALWITF